LPKNDVLELRLPPLPKGEAPEVEPADANAPIEKAGFGESDSASLDPGGLNREDDDVPLARLEKGADEAEDVDLGSDDADLDEKLKGDGSVVGAAGLGVNPVAGVAEFEGAAKDAKLDGGAGIVAGVEVAGLRKENGAAGMEGLLGGLGALCVFAGEDLPS
jgi:hypothetical protein